MLNAIKLLYKFLKYFFFLKIQIKYVFLFGMKNYFGQNRPLQVYGNLKSKIMKHSLENRTEIKRCNCKLRA